MTKKSFITKYVALTPAQKSEVKTYWLLKLTDAIFAESFEQAQRILLWIREAEEKGE